MLKFAAALNLAVAFATPVTPPINATVADYHEVACGLATKEECHTRTDCYYSYNHDTCYTNYLGRFETLFTFWLPSVHFHFFWALITLLTTAYLLFASVFKHPSMPRFLRADPGLMSYTLVSGIVVCALAAVGIVGVHNQYGQPGWTTPEIRLTRNTIYGDMVGQIHASYQLWNFAMSVLRRDGAISIVHHFFCAYLGILNSDGFGCYHLIYMGGVAELSTIILTVMDVFKNNPYLQEAYPKTNAYTRYTFCGVFILLRVFVWFYVLAKFFSDIYYYLTDDAITDKLYTHCIVNVLAMTVLSSIQLVWAKLVVVGIAKVLGIIKKTPKPADTDSAKKDSNAKEGDSARRSSSVESASASTVCSEKRMKSKSIDSAKKRR